MPQAPAAWAGAQGTPQPPQFELVLSWVSQPSFALFSLALQSSQPVLHETIEQTPDDEHAAVPWLFVHAWPQAPQSLSVLSGVSQPLFLLPSQSPQPEAQVGEQPLDVQALSPCALAQASPQFRQLSFVPSATSQPSVGTPLQSLWPDSHWSSSQSLFTHLPEALGNAHMWPQSPQFCASFERLVSHLPAPGQVSSGAVHLEMPHTESSQAGVPTLEVHALPQPPQLPPPQTSTCS